MIKRIFVVALCLAMLATPIYAAADEIKTPYASPDFVADVVIACKDPNVAVGGFLEVSVSLEKITLESGYIAFDLPLIFDKDMLELSYYEIKHPSNWDGVEDMTSQPEDGNYVYLHVLPDIPFGSPVNYRDYAVKEDNGVVFNLVFTAKKVGETTLTIKNDEANLLYKLVVDPDLKNYCPKDTSLAVSISAKEESPDNDSSVTESEPPAIEGSSTTEESTVIEESSVTESEPPVVDDSSESEPVPPVTESSSEAEESSEEGKVISIEAVESADADEKAPAASSATSKKKDEGGKTWVVVIIVAVAASAVCGGCVAYFVSRKKKAK